MVPQIIPKPLFISSIISVAVIILQFPVLSGYLTSLLLCIINIVILLLLLLLLLLFREERFSVG